ncbi:hypothetical protein [Streptomyces sp. NPDC051576]|uniref:hypothetical protein n=1 Tax=Streptomyces sp. NPDC051576 TaxID=3155803 RepID=UPI00341E3B72
MAVLHEREGRIDSGADAGRGDEAAVADVEGVRFDAHPGVAAGQGLRLPPVDRGRTAVEQTEFGAGEGTRADGRDPCRPVGEGAKNSDWPG